MAHKLCALFLPAVGAGWLLLVGNGQGQFLISCVISRVHTTRLVQQLSWVLKTQEREKVQWPSKHHKFLHSYVVWISWLEGRPTSGMQPGRLRASGICTIPCTYLLPKSLLRASVKIDFLFARISATKDPDVQPFQNRPLRASVFKITKNLYLDPNIQNFDYYYRVFTTRSCT